MRATQVTHGERRCLGYDINNGGEKLANEG